MPYLPPHPQPPVWGGTIAALVLSIAGFIFCLGPLGSVPGLILGIVGLNKCRRDPDLYGGRGMAIAAVIVGSIGTLICIGYLAVMMVAMIAATAS